MYQNDYAPWLIVLFDADDGRELLFSAVISLLASAVMIVLCRWALICLRKKGCLFGSRGKGKHVR